VGALAATFNIMTSRLGKAFEDVRRRSLAVQTSAEVSRRLSISTNPRQLAVEVVEQVQSAFNYYHAHIYFVDEVNEDLIMAGGTGEAGAKMLASGHRISKGRGLVGRAAATNAPVLVPDVSKAIGWLPNALLPDTKSELAIPISSGKQVLGVLDVQQNVINGLGEEDVALLESLASQVAISLQNARSFEQSKSRADLETLVNAIGQKIQRATTVDDTLQTAIREISLALGASRVSANIGKQVTLANTSHETGNS
jgi:GAF domain-containing protein